MARDPGSAWAPLPEAGAPDGYVKDKFIVHSTGDNSTAAATRRYFELAHVQPESTFIVGQGPHDPTLQIMDSTDRADANIAANGPGISVEVVGDGRGGYNAWQRSEIIRLGVWSRQNHPRILPQIIPTPTGAGYGWHIMFGAPGPWTSVAKICPGPIRISELRTDIFPAIFAGRIESEDDMFEHGDALRLSRVENAVNALIGVSERPLQVEARLNSKLDALTEVVRQLATKQGTPIDMAAVERVVEKGVADAIEAIETTVRIDTNP